MDQNPKAFDESLRNEVEKYLVERMISALESNQLDFIQMKASAGYILDNIHGIKNYSQFMVFLESLKTQWPVFLETYNFYNNKFFQEKEKAVVEKLSQYIKSSSNN